MAALHLLDGRPWTPDGPLDPLSLLGCYTSFVVRADRTVVDLAGHLDRLERDSADLLGRAVDRADVLRAVRAHLSHVAAPVRLRVAVLARTPPLQPQQVDGLHLATTSRPVPPEPDRPWTVRTVQHVRSRPRVKGVDPYLQLHLKREARLAGADDALLARGDELLEGTTWGLVALTDSAAVVAEDDVLPSLGARRVVAAAGLPVERRALRRDELAGLRLLVATNAVVPVTAIGRVDDAGVRTDPALLALLRRACAALPGEPLPD